MLIAAAAVAFAACQKEINQIETPNDGEFFYNFAINNADNEASVDTKASLFDDGTSLFLKWENGDSFGAFATDGSSNSNNRPSTVAVSGDSYTLKVASTVQLTSGSTVYAYFPYNSGAGTNKASATIKIDPVQTQKSTGFDASVMPMVGEPYTTTTTLIKDEETTVGEIFFANLGAIIEFNLYATSAISEQIKSVEFNSTSGNLAGNYSLNLTTVDFSDASTLALQGSGSAASVKTNLETPVDIPVSSTSAKEGTKVYMSVAPGNYAGTVVVTTTGHTYTFNVSSAKAFNRSKVKRLNANLSSVTPGDLPFEETWEVVTTPANFTAGTYVIMSSDKSSYLVNDATDKNPASAAAHWDGSGKLIGVTSDAKWVATVNSSGLQFASFANSSDILSMSNTAQGVAIGETTSNSIFTLEENATLGGESGYIATTGNNRYLALYTNGTWRGYTITASGVNAGYLNGDQNIKAAIFYKLNDSRTPLATPVLDIDDEIISWSAIQGAGSYTVTVGENVANVTTTTYDASELGLSAGYYSVSVVANPANSAINKASVAATGEVKIGTPTLTAPTLTKGTVTSSSITINWDAIDEADGYSAMIVNNADSDDFDLKDVTGTSVTFTGLSASTEYTIYVSATDSRNRFASSSQAEIVAETAEQVTLTKGTPSWNYTFSSQQFSTSTLTAMLNGKEWTATNSGTYFGYDSTKGQQFGSSSVKTETATLTSNFGSTYGVENIVINASMASSGNAKLSVKVNGVFLKCESSTEVSLTTSATDYEFVADELLAGDIVITLSQTTTKAMYIKSIAINPEPPTVTGISVEEYSASVTKGTGSYSFDGKVYAVYSDDSKVELNSTEYEVSGSVDLSTEGTYKLTFTYGVFSKDIDIEVVGSTEYYTKVTDVSSLSAGDQLIFVYETGNVAMSTTQNNNNRGQQSVTITASGIAVNTMSSYVQVLTLEGSSGAWEFNTGSGYLNSPSDNNYLRTLAESGTYTKWTISISSGTATITNASRTSYYIAYNSSNSIFSCYKTGQNKFQIYRLAN